MSTLAGVHAVLPAHRYSQKEMTEAFSDLCLGPQDNRALLARLHSNAGVSTRHTVLPLEQYATIKDFGEANDLFLTHAVALAAEALTGALDRAGIAAQDVDFVMSTTVTGVAVPSIEARVAQLVGLRPDIKRMPLFGLGCAGGAAGLSLLHDYLVGHPDQVGVLLSVELCSLTLQRGDPSIANMVASGLFGDGAAAVVAMGANRSAEGPRVIDSRSHIFPDSLQIMGWDVGPTGMKIVLDAKVPQIVQKYLGDDIRELLAAYSLGVQDVGAWVCHTGGPKVIESLEAVLGLEGNPLELTWASLAKAGNLSSASVLHVLRDTLDQRAPAPGSAGVMMAMGPGFFSELVLLEW